MFVFMSILFYRAFHCRYIKLKIVERLNCITLQVHFRTRRFLDCLLYNYIFFSRTRGAGAGILQRDQPAGGETTG
jgi:hypothetical protein